MTDSEYENEDILSSDESSESCESCESEYEPEVSTIETTIDLVKKYIISLNKIELEEQIKKIKPFTFKKYLNERIKFIKNEYKDMKKNICGEDLRKLKDAEKRLIKNEERIFECNKKKLTKFENNLKECHNIKLADIDKKELIINSPDYLKVLFFKRFAQNDIKKSGNKLLKKWIKDEHLLDLIYSEEFDKVVFQIPASSISYIIKLMKEFASGVDYYKFYMFIANCDFNLFIEQIQKEINTNGAINDINFIFNILPKFLDNAKKRKFLEDIFNKKTYLDMDDIAGFLKYKQSSGEYCKVWDFLVDYYGLEYDDNGVPKFTTEFPFDSNIKKEGFLIWLVLKFSKENEFLMDNFCYLSYSLQQLQQTILLPKVDNKRLDLVFDDLDEVFEPNELHHELEQVQMNDELKKCYAKLGGKAVHYIEFVKISSLKLSSTKVNYNRDLLNSDYLKDFIKEFNKIMISALLKYPPCRNKYIIKLLKDSLGHQVSAIKETCKLYEQDPELNQNDIHKGKLHILELKEEVLKNLENDESIKDMFECKENKYISFEKICKLFQLDIKNELHNEKIKKLKECMCILNIIVFTNVDIDKITVNWTQLLEIIDNFDHGLKELKETLHQYWLELDKNYEIIIEILKEYNDSIISNTEDLNKVEKFIREKFDQKLYEKDQIIKQKEREIYNLTH